MLVLQHGHVSTQSCRLAYEVLRPHCTKDAREVSTHLRDTAMSQDLVCLKATFPSYCDRDILPCEHRTVKTAVARHELERTISDAAGARLVHAGHPLDACSCPSLPIRRSRAPTHHLYNMHRLPGVYHEVLGAER